MEQARPREAPSGPEGVCRLCLAQPVSISAISTSSEEGQPTVSQAGGHRLLKPSAWGHNPPETSSLAHSEGGNRQSCAPSSPRLRTLGYTQVHPP